MPRQVSLDGVELMGVNLFRDKAGLRVQVHYTVLSGAEVYRTQVREVSAELDPGLVSNLNSAWDSLLAMVREREAI